MCFSFLFPSLPPHTLAADTKTPNAKSTLQAGWHKHSTILAQASFCRGILSETLWHIQASLLSSWGPCLPQSRQQQGALTTNVLSISLCVHQTKQQHFVSVHWSPPSPKNLSELYSIFTSTSNGEVLLLWKERMQITAQWARTKRDTIQVSGANARTYNWLHRT